MHHLHGTARGGAALLAGLLLAGCGGPGLQSALSPGSPQAERLAGLSWGMFAVAALILVGTLSALVVALWRGGDSPRPLTPAGQRWLVIAGGLLLPAIVLPVLIVSSFQLSRSVLGAPPPDALAIDVIGHQFWWEIHYQDRDGQRIATAANELHVPVGRPVRLQLSTRDVIHSFWVPNLHGKMDMVPGQVNLLSFEAREPGIYRGQCAEYCGVQHSLMAFLVVAQPRAEFDAWLERQRQPAASPATPVLQEGFRVFMGSRCPECHTLRGTRADGKHGPDLTRLGSRRTLGAGTVPNTRGHLAGWILDPQGVKPGNQMPPIDVGPEDLPALLAYLESLK